MTSYRSLRDPRPTLAIVDDEQQVAEVMAEAATQLGYRVSTAFSAEELFTQKDTSYDLIILDLNMPKIDGIQCLRQLAEEGSKSRIILTSGYDPRLLETAISFGEGLGLEIAGIIEKPFRISELRKILTKEESPGIHSSSKEYPIALDDVLQAMDEGEFEMHYQPQIHLATGTLAGIEALIRWEHPKFGMVPPNAFLPIVEEHNLSLLLFRYVTERVMSGCRIMKHYLPPCSQISVNLPPSALTQAEFPEEILQLADNMGCPAERIKFELTETSISENFSKAYEIVSRLRLKGYGVSMDDFGTGYSSLAQFSKLPFTQVKIDMHFVQNAEICKTSRVIVENTIQMAKKLKINVVAEGVEKYQTYDWLREVGCDVAQGWFIAKAMPPRSLLRWLPELDARGDLKPLKIVSGSNLRK